MSGDSEIEREVEDIFAEQSALVRASTNPVVQFVLGTAPYTGGVGSLLSQQAQRRQEKRLRRFLVDLSEDVESRWVDLEAKIDKQFVVSDEFASILEDVLTEVGRTSDQVKIRYLHNYVLNAARHERPDADWRELLRGYVSQLTGTHLTCLYFIYMRQRRIGEQDRYGAVRTPDVPVAIEALVREDAYVRLRLAKVCFSDLAHLGLLVDWRELGNSGPGYQSEYCITENGLQLMRFLTGRWRLSD